MSIKSVAVYGGGAETISEEYRALAHEMGRRIGLAGLRLVYGGQTNGLLGPLADGAMSAGGHVLGIMSKDLPENLSHKGITELRMASNFQNRKRAMEDEADAFIILPGSLATLDEMFSPIPSKRHGQHNKPIILLNYNGFWNLLVAMMGYIAETGFAHSGDGILVRVASNCDGAMKLLEEAQTLQSCLKPQKGDYGGSAYSIVR